MKFDASVDPKKNAFQLFVPGLHRGGVVRVRPTRRAEIPEIERGRDREQHERARAGPNRGRCPARATVARHANVARRAEPAARVARELEGFVRTRWADDAHAIDSGSIAVRRGTSDLDLAWPPCDFLRNDLEQTWSSSANCTSQSAPNTERLAKGSAIARADVDQCATDGRDDRDHDRRRDETGDRQQPRTARARARSRRGPSGPTPSGGWRGTTARCRSTTAITLADPAGTPAPSASATRIAALSRVVPTETTRQRDMRCTSARAFGRRAFDVRPTSRYRGCSVIATLRSRRSARPRPATTWRPEPRPARRDSSSPRRRARARRWSTRSIAA